MKAKLICLTPVRNEAWVLHAFLQATSLWADYIIIADQNSTDGSREIVLSYPKVILVDNPIANMHQSRTRQILFDEANKIDGDKIIFTLDADEILSGNFLQSNGWKRILESKQGEIFAFRWINLYNSLVRGVHLDTFMEWACNYGGNVAGRYQDAHIHEMRLPIPENESWITIDDIWFLHFSHLVKMRQINKDIFYQVSTVYAEPNKSIVSLHRMYHHKSEINLELIDDGMWTYYKQTGIDFTKLIDLNDVGLYYVNEITRMMSEKDVEFFAGLDIWKSEDLKGYDDFKDPRGLLMRLIHLYLNATSKYKAYFSVRAVDKLLKNLGF